MKALYLRRNEQSFLADQAANAKTAMTGTLDDMKDTLKRVADVPSCAKQHPWLVVGWAVAAGFVTGAVLTSVPRKTVKTIGSSTEAELQSKCDVQETPGTKKSLLFATVATVLAGVLQTVANSWIAAAVAAHEEPQAETPLPHESTVNVDPND
jgi:hypothetical protein